MGPKLERKCYQVVAKLAQYCMKADISKTYKNRWKTMIFHVSPAPFGPKMAQVDAKLVVSWFKWAQVRPELAQVGSMRGLGAAARGSDPFRSSPLVFGEYLARVRPTTRKGKYPASSRRVANEWHTFVGRGP